jgi:hypothetical protein
MKDKICGICRTAIDTDKEYCEFKQYKKVDVIQSKAYYHVNCFRDRINGVKEQKEALKTALNTLSRVQERFGLNNNGEVRV